MTAPSAAARRAALAADGAALCVALLLALGLALSPTGTLIAVAFFGFLLLPSLFGAVWLARTSRRLRRGARAGAQLVTSAVLLLPGALFVSYLGAQMIQEDDASWREAVYGWASAILGPAVLLLGSAAPLLARPARPSLPQVLGSVNTAVLVVAVSVALSWAEPGTTA